MNRILKMKNIRDLIKVGFIAAVLLSICLMATASPPNVILVVTDDQGYGDPCWPWNLYCRVFSLLPRECVPGFLLFPCGILCTSRGTDDT